MQSIRLIFSLILLLAVGSGASLGPGFGTAHASAAHGGAAEPAQPSAEGAPGIFVSMRTMTVPVIRDGRIKGRLSLNIVIEVAPGEDHSPVMVTMRRIEDAFTVELHTLLGQKWPNDATVDLEVARQRLLERARRIAGREVVAGLYFQWVQDRRS